MLCCVFLSLCSLSLFLFLVFFPPLFLHITCLLCLVCTADQVYFFIFYFLVWLLPPPLIGPCGGCGFGGHRCRWSLSFDWLPPPSPPLILTSLWTILTCAPPPKKNLPRAPPPENCGHAPFWQSENCQSGEAEPER